MESPTQRFYTPGDRAHGAMYEEMEAERIKIDAGFKKVQDELDAGPGGGAGKVMLVAALDMLKNYDAPNNFVERSPESGPTSGVKLEAGKKYSICLPNLYTAEKMAVQFAGVTDGGTDLDMTVEVKCPTQSVTYLTYNKTGTGGIYIDNQSDDTELSAGQKTKMAEEKSVLVLITNNGSTFFELISLGVTMA